MNADELLRFYERVADAPDAVARLRRFVLDLAVRGKLVPQDEKDAPSEELLRAVSATSCLHGLPAQWRCAPTGALLDFQYGKGLPAGERAAVGPVPIFGSNGVVGYTDTPLTDLPSVIVGRKGSAGALNICVGPSWTTDVAYFVEAPIFFDLKYLFLALSALGLDRLGKGVKPGLSRSDAYQQALWVPPLAEQHRIVAKVDELMALCDRLDAARAIREAARDRLAAASLARLNAPDPEYFHEDARFALDALPALTTRPDQIKQFRQTILNFAVRGLLVPQQSTAGSVRIPARVAVGFDEEVFEYHSTAIALPAGWKIAPLAQVSDHVVDCPHSTPVWTERGEICVRTNQLRPRFLDLSESRYVSRETYLQRIERLEPRQDDILYSREGGILGVACRVPTGVRLCLGQRLMLIRPSVEVASVFLELVLNSPFITGIAKQRTTGGAAPRVNMSTVRGFPIPLPPLTEQHRIVGKVDELMALCDRLEASLASTDTHRRRLLEALLHNALQPSNLALATA